ncbi:glycosyltransferase [Glutamicibacter ardleyensis]|uniref:glycosyltransferase n=1 Tax=Glutamicibacter ardleyensis TaxID=225894 RepID=UPI003FCF42B7
MNNGTNKNQSNEQYDLTTIESLLKHNELLSADLAVLSNVLRQANRQYKILQTNTPQELTQVHTHLVSDVHHESSEGQLKIAAIMDEFTASAFSLASNLLLPKISSWEKEIREFGPDLLLVESAWQGNSGSWAGQVHRVSPELLKLISWCEENKIPTVFWNKEDPVHFDSFVATASLFQFVFTTDLESIERYKKNMRHDNVFLMPFFCEPKLHSPLRTIERKQGASFAGAYYHRYPERSSNFETIVSSMEGILDVVIYDRNHGEVKPEFAFPERYLSLIKGKLDFQDIDISYKGYEFGINLNSVKQSPTMFARRAFDLILSNTHVVSNYSKGLRLMFGDLVISSDHGSEITESVKRLIDSTGSSAYTPYAAFVRHEALQKVLRQHTTSVRLKYITEKIWSKAPSILENSPGVDVVGFANNRAELDSVIRIFESQDLLNKKLYVVSSNLASDDIRNIPRDVEVILKTVDLVPSEFLQSEYVAVIDSDKFYDNVYLSNSVNYLQLGSYDGVVRTTSIDDVYGLKAAFTTTSHGYADSAVFKRRYFDSLVVANVISERLCAPDLLCVPSFDFAANAEAITQVHDWGKALDVGTSIDRLIEAAEDIPVPAEENSFVEGIRGVSLESMFEPKQQRVSMIGFSVNQLGLQIESVLETDEHRYVYSNVGLNISSFPKDSDEAIQLHAIMTPGLSSSLVVLMLNAQGERLDAKILTVNRNHTVAIAPDCKYVKLGLRLQGAGTSVLQGISFESLVEKKSKTPILSRKKNLVLTNVYPSADNLYRNGFVHSRVRRYQEALIDTSVFTLNPRAKIADYTFEGVDVHVGGEDELRRILMSNEFESILVHFLDENMWNVLRDVVTRTRILVWVHGAEVQPWYRRDFNYANEQERDKAKIQSHKRIAFWRDIFKFPHPNIHYIFVSDYFYNEVMEDTEAFLQEWQYSVIHNFVDSDIFNYVDKSIDKRFKILSIRPYASRKYANDLSVEAVRLLSSHPKFAQAEFLFVGDGPLFDEVLEPIRDFANVTVRRSFLSQPEISALHDEYGVFLTPTRMDSQGVSRDEAMSSGLVPVTTAVTAIPEFMDENCGILAGGESSSDMASGIVRLWDDPELFSQMSKNSAQRVRNQCSFDATIGAEVALIRNRKM